MGVSLKKKNFFFFLVFILSAHHRQSVFAKFHAPMTLSKFTSSLEPGAQFGGDLGEILTLGVDILPYIGLGEKWESP